jgi:hypothetical protein
MHTIRTATALVLTGLLGACAGAAAPPGPPDYAAIAGSQAGPRARLYADCIGQSVDLAAYDHVRDDDSELIRFTCEGAPARAFYDGLAARSAAIGSEWTHDGRTWRSTNKVQANLFGVDHCSFDGAAGYRCVVILNAGEFLAD